MRPFSDRHEAGRMLALQLLPFARRRDAIVLGLPRGGVPVAFEVASALDLPLDTFVVRKIGAPFNEELAIGALASGGVVMVDEETVRLLQVTRDQLEATIARERAELERRERAYRGDNPAPTLAGKTVILVDDGLATGSTMLAALHAVRAHHPADIVVVVPVAATEACALMRREGVACYCLATPEPFFAVGAWYRDFSPTTDADVQLLLSQTTAGRGPAA